MKNGTITDDRARMQWGMARNNRGIARTMLGKREAGTECLEDAVIDLRSALKKALTRERAPLDWAAAQNNLGNAYAALGERHAGTHVIS